MKVSELIKMLQSVPPDTEVLYHYDGKAKGSIEAIVLTTIFETSLCAVLIDRDSLNDYYCVPKTVIMATNNR